MESSEELLFEALSKFPEMVKSVSELSESVSKNNQTVSDNISAICKTIAGQNERMDKMEARLSALSKSIAAAASQMQKEVTVQVRPADIHLTKDDIKVAVEQVPSASLLQMEEEYARIKKNEKRPVIINGKWVFLVLSAILLAIVIALAFLFHKQGEAKEAWGSRCYEAAVELGMEHPGEYYGSTVERFNNGYDAEAKSIVIDLEKKAKEQSNRIRKYEKRLAAYLSNVEHFGKGIQVSSFVEETVKGAETVLVKFTTPGDSKEWKAVIVDDKTVDFTYDENVNSVKDAVKGFKRSIWMYGGDIESPFVVSR